jgi:hypothetical protein
VDRRKTFPKTSVIFSENEQKNEENRTDSGGFVDIRIFNIITGYHHVWRKTRDLRDLRNMEFSGNSA